MVDIEREAREIENAVRARCALLYGTLERDSAVRAACARAVVAAVLEWGRGRGIEAAIIVRENAIIWALADARDSLSARAIDKGRVRAGILREYADMVARGLDSSGWSGSSVDRYWFIACAIQRLLLHPWWGAQYGANNHARYFRRYARQSSLTVARLREADRVARIQEKIVRLNTYHASRGPVVNPGCEMPWYAR